MHIDVAAALVGDDAGALAPQEVLDGASPDTPWQYRPQVVIEAEPQTLLSDIVDRGAAFLNLVYRSNEWYSDYLLSSGQRHFVFDGEEFGGRYAKFNVVLVDGAARWWFDSDASTVQDAIDAHKAGLLLGNPHHIYIVIDEPEKPVGNGVDYWLNVIENIPYLKQYLQAAGIVGSLAGGVKGLRKTLSYVREHLYSAGGSLEGYGNLFAIPRTTHQVATLLQLPEEDVSSICHFLGMRYIDDAWRPDTNRARRNTVN